jgi:hypothetical protein
MAGRRRTLSKADGWRLAMPVEPSRTESTARGKCAWRGSIAGVIGKKGKEGRGVTDGSAATLFFFYIDFSFDAAQSPLVALLHDSVRA